VAPERIVFAEMVPKPAHLRRIMLADAFLDSPVRAILGR
jgi:predicted O-linked N-acetylglucosamine transferase (SPINDLY family)